MLCQKLLEMPPLPSNINGSSIPSTSRVLAHGFLLRRQAAPPDLLLLLANNTHGHQDIKSIINASPDVLLVEGRAVASE